MLRLYKTTIDRNAEHITISKIIEFTLYDASSIAFFIECMLIPFTATEFFSSSCITLSTFSLLPSFSNSSFVFFTGFLKNVCSYVFSFITKKLPTWFAKIPAIAPLYSLLLFIKVIVSPTESENFSANFLFI